MAAVAVANVSVLMWREHSAAATYRAEREAAERSEAAARETWIAALRQNPDGHGPPGVGPPMLEVIDEGRNVHVTNTTQEWLTVALARVLQNNQGEWLACPLLTVGEHADYYRVSIGPGHTAQYAPVRDCAAGFEGAPSSTASAIRCRIRSAGGRTRRSPSRRDAYRKPLMRSRACSSAWTILPSPRAALVRIDPGELGAQQKDLRRVVDPHEQHDERAAAPNPDATPLRPI